MRGTKGRRLTPPRNIFILNLEIINYFWRGTQPRREVWREKDSEIVQVEREGGKYFPHFLWGDANIWFVPHSRDGSPSKPISTHFLRTVPKLLPCAFPGSGTGTCGGVPSRPNPTPVPNNALTHKVNQRGWKGIGRREGVNGRMVSKTNGIGKGGE